MRRKQKVSNWKSQKLSFILLPLTPRCWVSHAVLDASKKRNSRITKKYKRKSTRAEQRHTGMTRETKQSSRKEGWLRRDYNRGLHKQRSVTTTGPSTLWGQLLEKGYSLVLIKQELGITQWIASSYKRKDLFILHIFKLALVVTECSEVQKTGTL